MPFAISANDVIEDAKRIAGSGNIFAFVAAPVGSKVGLGIAILGQPGFYHSQVAKQFNDFPSASEYAEKLNQRIGYNAETSIAIIAETMGRSQLKKDAEDGVVTLKFNQEELEYLREGMDEMITYDDDIADKIDGALEELRENAEKNPTPGF